jgi:hypothetical protein
VLPGFSVRLGPGDRANDVHVTVTADASIDSLWIWMSGLGVGHAWTQLHLSVSDGESEIASQTTEPGKLAVIASSGSIPQDGKTETEQESQPIQLACTFLRLSSNTTDHLATLQQSQISRSSGTTA